MGLPGPPKRSRDPVAAIRFTASATPFQRPRGFPENRRPTPKRRKLPWTLASLQGTPERLRRSLAAPATLMGFSASTATSAWRSTNPGFHTRFVPPSGFPTLLTVYSLQRLPTTRIGATHEVHPADRFPYAEPYAFRRHCPLAVSGMAFSCSEDQKITMPRDSRALLPAKIRTPVDRGPPEPMLSWAFTPLQSVSPHAVEPASRPLPSCASHDRPAGGRSCGAPRPYRASG
jgi:hypothetical protein